MARRDSPAGREVFKALRLSAADWARIQARMALAGTTNFSAYARRVLVDGELRVQTVAFDAEVLRAELGRIGNNLNQIARHANTESSLTLSEAVAARRLMQEVQQLLSAATRPQNRSEDRTDDSTGDRTDDRDDAGGE